jgi:hypothetical protein
MNTCSRKLYEEFTSEMRVVWLETLIAFRDFAPWKYDASNVVELHPEAASAA